MAGDDQGIDRRTWLTGASAVAVASGLPLGCDRTAQSQSTPKSVPAEAVALLGELGPGASVERWTIVAIHPIRHGALPIVLTAPGGTPFQVDVLARDPGGAQGVANTESLSLFVANRGDGGTPTDEDQGLGAMALARALAKRQSAGAETPTLSTFAQRAQTHPNGAFAVPLG